MSRQFLTPKITIIPYSAKFSWVFNFANFANFQLFVKLFQRKFLTRNLQFLRARASMDNIPGLCCRIRKGHSPKRYLRSRHCFADSCELERGQWCGQCVLVACMPRPYYITLRRAHGLDTEFAKLFRRNFQKPPFAKI